MKVPEMLSKGLNDEFKKAHPRIVMLVDVFTIISIIYTLFIPLIIL